MVFDAKNRDTFQRLDYQVYFDGKNQDTFSDTFFARATQLQQKRVSRHPLQKNAPCNDNKKNMPFSNNK